MNARPKFIAWLVVVVLLAVVVSGCEQSPSRVVVDQCLRQTLFARCLAAVPPGPTSTATSNDWDEVVNACEHAAYYQSRRQRGTVAPGCQTGE